MKETEFLRKRNVIPKDGTDLIIGFDNGTKESLIGLLKEYHESELKKMRVADVSVSVCDLHDNMNDCDMYRFRKQEACRFCKYKQTVH